MADKIARVNAFLDAWRGGKAAMYASFPDYLAPGCEWENVGLTRSVGVDEAVACFRAFEAILDYHHIAVDVHHSALVGNVVFNERDDRLVDEGGTTVAVVRCAGVFEMDEAGMIGRWRDYFDTQGFNDKSVIERWAV